ncbi:MAG: glycoside hydrolase family 2 [Paenibacillus sp.]|nr:glycoside hydrolase family 2 [Paenibacillus sp.]
MPQEILRPEYPRPQLVREHWLNLNGKWEFEFDDERIGDENQWGLGTKAFSRQIQVPFAYQSKLSGIGETGFHDLVWYRRSFTIPADWSNQSIVLHFGAVDYAATVWGRSHSTRAVTRRFKRTLHRRSSKGTTYWSFARKISAAM